MSGGHGGRPSSWVVVGVSITGFTVGGVALCIGPNWVVFGVGAAIVAISAVLGLAVGILSDVVVDEPRVMQPVAAGAPAGRVEGEVEGEVPTATDPEQRPHG
ncbi:HGxxPAAW family protein [Thermomonospora umbrina]|uniref:Uncharacterized protein n=1 Tax=Thermomonospora umbrina TaxID=111806 RepID=A0A3D9SW10_9ACTN|nr:HGxxPAAW family protein [Thermomonospora umbrina]REF00113.1 hypothetical protein DFJ69_5641 [Thermomonospora umbrina]